MTNSTATPTFQVARTQELVYELKVQEAMNAKVITVEPDNTMEDVRGILKEHRLSGTPVTKGGELVGIVSIEDLIQSLLVGDRNHLVRQCMSASVMVLYADEPLVFAVKKFEQYGYGRFPVIDRKTKELVGILTKGDILRCVLRRLEIDYHEQEVQRYKPSVWFSGLDSDRITLGLRYRIEGSDFEKAGEASSKLKRSLRTLGIPPSAARRVVIASYEAEMNVVIFGGGGELVATVEPGKSRSPPPTTVQESPTSNARCSRASRPRRIGFGSSASGRVWDFPTSRIALMTCDWTPGSAKGHASSLWCSHDHHTAPHRRVIEPDCGHG